MPASRKRRFIRVRELAEALDVSEMTIRRAYAAKAIPGITFGTTCRILRRFAEDLLQAAESGQQITVEEFGREWMARNKSETPEAVAS